MNNTALNTEKFYSVKEVAEMLNLHLTTVRRGVWSGILEAMTIEANGGEQYRISHAALVKYAEKKNINLSSQNGDDRNYSPSEQGITPFSSAQGFSLMNTQVSSLLKMARNVEKDVIPAKAKEVALARQDVLNAWEDFRSKAGSKTKADKDFVSLFNSGIYYPELFKQVATISTGTLYRWKKDFSEVGNYTALLPQYKYRSMFVKQTELTEIEKKYFLDLMLQPNRLSVGNAHRLIKFVLQKQQITEVHSYSTFKRFSDWFEKAHKDVWVLMREGQKALVDKVAPYIERDPSVLNVGDVLVADGHVLDFQVINPFNGKPCRAMLVGYVDWKSYALAGYEIMLTENTQNIASALRNSIINLGKIPKICYQDNGKGFRAKYFNETKDFNECGFHGLFGKLGIVPVFATPYNAKAKIIERFFREFSETCEKMLPSYVGNSPTNKPAYMMRNEKFHKEIHNKFIPTIEQAHSLIQAWLEFHNSQPCPHVAGKTIGEVFSEGCGEGVDIDLLDDLLMASESRKLGRNGVKFLGHHYFSESLYGITDKVEIRYSLFDLSYVKVYTQNGEYLGKAETVLKLHPMASVIGDQKDVYSLKKAIRDTKKFQKDTMAKARQLLPHLNKEHLEWQKAIETKQPEVIEVKKTALPQDYFNNYEEIAEWQPKKKLTYDELMAN